MRMFAESALVSCEHFGKIGSAPDPETGRAMTAALDVLTGLGAEVEEVQLRPLQYYYDIKNMVTKPEVFAVHHRRLIERLGDFGDDFLALTLPGCLISATDHAHALSLLRRCRAEQAGLFERHDVLMTVSSGPAPELASCSASRVIDHWSSPNVETPFSVLGGPAITVPNGRTAQGLPLGMQIAGRPQDDQTVLNVAYAYEQATAWHRMHPDLAAAHPRVTEQAQQAITQASSATSDVYDFVRSRARQAGLTLIGSSNSYVESLPQFLKS
jgi:aspartyl-tRNA(Asn)/glutamyl-tRNA(Gln) amidotransferase subunit A